MADDAQHIVDTLGLAAAVEARTGGQRLVLASARGAGLDGVDVIREIVWAYGWELLTHGTRGSKVARWPRLLTALRPQVLPHLTARFLQTEQITCQRACSGSTEQAAPRFILHGHQAEYRLSVGHQR